MHTRTPPLSSHTYKHTRRARTEAVESDTLQTLFDKHVPVILDLLATLRMDTIAPVLTINMAQVKRPEPEVQTLCVPVLRARLQLLQRKVLSASVLAELM